MNPARHSPGLPPRPAGLSWQAPCRSRLPAPRSARAPIGRQFPEIARAAASSPLPGGPIPPFPLAATVPAMPDADSAAHMAAIGEPGRAALGPPAAMPGPRRWAASAWLLVRPDGGGAALAPGGTLGGSQAGARLLRRLGGGFALSGRLYSPLRRIRRRRGRRRARLAAVGAPARSCPRRAAAGARRRGPVRLRPDPLWRPQPRSAARFQDRRLRPGGPGRPARARPVRRRFGAGLGPARPDRDRRRRLGGGAAGGRARGRRPQRLLATAGTRRRDPAAGGLALPPRRRGRARLPARR